MLAACVRGCKEEVQGIIDDGGDASKAEGMWGTTPLMAASAPTEKLDVLEFLLGLKGAKAPNLDNRNNKGMTALHQAAWYGQEGAVILLLRAGADRFIATPDGQTAEQMALSMGHTAAHACFAPQAPPPESAEQLRERIRMQSRQNSDKRLLAARQGVFSAASLPPPPPLTPLSPESTSPASKPPEEEEDESKATPSPPSIVPCLAGGAEGELWGRIRAEGAGGEAKTVRVESERGGVSRLMEMAKRVEETAEGRKARGEEAACARRRGGAQDEEIEVAIVEAEDGQREGAVSARGASGGAPSFFITQEGSMGKRIAALVERPLAERNRPEWLMGGTGKVRPASAAVPGRRGRLR